MPDQTVTSVSYIFPIVVVVILVLFILGNAIRILREYERGVVFRLGRLVGAKGPGLILLIPIVDKMVMEPTKAIVDVEDYIYATSQIAQTTLRSILGQVELDDLLSNRDKINAELQAVIDQQTEPWGVKVAVVEVKNVDLPQEMQRAIAKQAEAERERRAKVIHADGEFQASAKINDAANILAQNSVGIQLRYLQTLVEIAAEKNSTTLFPIPIELFRPFIESYYKDMEAKKQG
jgi:regulator of protease activity HflC (stomatin/prohibitin superfamily)